MVGAGGGVRGEAPMPEALGERGCATLVCAEGTNLRPLPCVRVEVCGDGRPR